MIGEIACGGCSEMDLRVREAIVVMRRSLANELTMPLLSTAVHLSPARLSQLFKKHTGQSPMRYLRDLRMLQTIDLLQNTFLSIKEITARSGFGNVSHFARAFKKRTGLAPSHFRASIQSNVKEDNGKLKHARE